MELIADKRKVELAITNINYIYCQIKKNEGGLLNLYLLRGRKLNKSAVPRYREGAYVHMLSLKHLQFYTGRILGRRLLLYTFKLSNTHKFKFLSFEICSINPKKGHIN